MSPGVALDGNDACGSNFWTLTVSLHMWQDLFGRYFALEEEIRWMELLVCLMSCGVCSSSSNLVGAILEADLNSTSISSVIRGYRRKSGKVTCVSSFSGRKAQPWY